MTNADSDRLLAEGRRLTLHREEESRDVVLKYDMRGLKFLEDSFGSLEAAGRALDQLGKPPTGSAVDTVIALAGLDLTEPQAAALRRALATVIPLEDHKRAETVVLLLHAGLHRTFTADELWDWVDPRDLLRYAEAITLAIYQAFPMGAEGTNPNGAAGTGDSPGGPPGTSPSPQAPAPTTSGV